jgi:hypothetical protein
MNLLGAKGYSATIRADPNGASLDLSDGRKHQEAFEKSLSHSKSGKSKPLPNLLDIPSQDLSLTLYKRGDVSTGGIGLDVGLGKQRILLGTDVNGAPSLELDDETGHTRAVFGNEALENTRTGSTENTGPSSLVFLGKNGRVIWRAP